VTIADNLSNSSEKVLARIFEVSKAAQERVEFVAVDLRDEASLTSVFKTHQFAGVVHFAAFKAVGESRLKPITYFDNNLVACISLMKVMGAAGCKTLIFSSSCTVYGESPPPLAEDAPTGAGITNAYGRSKHIMEQMLQDVHSADSLEGHELAEGGPWRICVLRYFNPVGAHPSGRLGEDPRGIPNCLMPYVLQTLVGRRERLTVHGSNYPTADGTCVRDYIHVCDVASGHVDALRWISKQPAGPLLETFNFGKSMYRPAGRVLTVFHSTSDARTPDRWEW
jgi:UDP-glucose 4-epimerase